VVLLRRPVEKRAGGRAALTLDGEEQSELFGENRGAIYEYQILVANLTVGALGVADLHRQRADCENSFDRLQNQWGWRGLGTKDLLRCQFAARNLVLIYNL
jgi:hypothetical protein